MTDEQDAIKKIKSLPIYSVGTVDSLHTGLMSSPQLSFASSSPIVHLQTTLHAQTQTITQTLE